MTAWSKALLLGLVIEAIAIVPALVSPWGHAGPEWTVGWLSLAANLPGLFLLHIAGAGDLSFGTLAAGTYVIQAAIISGLAFLWFRRRAAKAA